MKRVNKKENVSKVLKKLKRHVQPSSSAAIKIQIVNENKNKSKIKLK